MAPHAEGVELVGRGGGLEPLSPQPTGLSVLGHEGLVSVPFCNGLFARGVGWNRERRRGIVGLGVASLLAWGAAAFVFREVVFFVLEH